ncbi:MAG TPA: hypothetical protein PLU35_05650 [Phycisphaerales bacterium]|nr:hypothetical protein [Phycisphaerales bacterium]
MSHLVERVRDAISSDRFVFSDHADEALAVRGVRGWQVLEAMDRAKLLGEFPRSRPNPKVEFEILLPDGTEAKAVWSWLGTSGTAKLVTVHFFDR